MTEECKLNRFPVRKNPRLKNFDYSSYNYYFVTICVWNKQCIFGTPSKLSYCGEVARDCVNEISQHFPKVKVDKWVVMPNHVHLIMVLPGDNTTLSTVIGQYKAAVTKKIHGIQPGLWIWQAFFHDHVIRTQADYERIWAYIDTNPARWMDDCFYIPEPEL